MHAIALITIASAMMKGSKKYHAVKLIVILLSLILKGRLQGMEMPSMVSLKYKNALFVCNIAARPILALNTTSSHGMVCPQATFNCNATDLPSTTLRWFINDDIIAAYPYDPSDQFPQNIQSMSTYGVTIRILEASLNASSMDRASFHSTLSGNLSVIREMGGHNISCGSTGTKSNSVDLDSILIRGIHMYNVQ